MSNLLKRIYKISNQICKYSSFKELKILPEGTVLVISMIFFYFCRVISTTWNESIGNGIKKNIFSTYMQKRHIPVTD